MQKGEAKTEKKGKAEGERKGPAKKQIPQSEEEKNANAKVAKYEKQIEELVGRLKEVFSKLREREITRNKLSHEMFSHREAVKEIQSHIDEKINAQKESFNRAVMYIDSLRKRKHRRADERAELVKLLPHDAQLPSLREDDENGDSVNDYDRAIKIVQQEIAKLEHVHATSPNTVAEERKLIGVIARWNSVIEQIKELQAKAAAPLADLADVDVMACLETCRKLKGEIAELRKSCIPHFDAIAAACKKMEENRADVPKLIETRVSIMAQIKEVSAQLSDAQFELDKARVKSRKAYNEKRHAELAQESAAIKARLEEIRKNRQARIDKAMNTLPHEREVEIANKVLTYLRSIALPGTCGISESSAPKPKAEKPAAAAPAAEVQEASFGATTMVISRKSQPIPKVGKKQNKKKKAPAADAPKEEPKKKTKEDAVRITPLAASQIEELSLTVPENYGQVEETYNAVKEKLEGFEKVRAMVKEQHEKDLKEAEKKAEEEAARKEEERAKAKAEKAAEETAAAAAEEKPAEEKPAEEKPAEEKPAEEKPEEEKPAEEKPVEEKPAEEQPAPEEPAAESQ